MASANSVNSASCKGLIPAAAAAWRRRRRGYGPEEVWRSRVGEFPATARRVAPLLRAVVATRQCMHAPRRARSQPTRPSALSRPPTDD